MHAESGSTFEGSDAGMTPSREGQTLLRAHRRLNLAYLGGRAGICIMAERMAATAAGDLAQTSRTSQLRRYPDPTRWRYC